MLIVYTLPAICMESPYYSRSAFFLVSADIPNRHKGSMLH